MNDFVRASSFEEARRDRCAEQILPFAFGKALFNHTYPRVWDLNLLRVDDPSGATVELLSAEAERLHGQAAHDHRRIALEDDKPGAELEPAFRALGWQPERYVFMAYRGSVERAAETREVREVDVGAIRPLREKVARGEPWATDDEVVRMVLDADELMAHHGCARHFASLVNGEVVSGADLLSDGQTAQVEDVVTHPDFRRRGLASAVVLRAVEEARAAGHDFIFLAADDADWPKELYTRLGFAAIGRKWAFVRPPAPAGPAGTPRAAPAA